MTRVGWLADRAEVTGGAELTQAEFRAAAPSGVEIVECPPAGVDADCDRYVVHNCVQYTLDDLEVATGMPTFKFWHDVGPWVRPEVRDLLNALATPICCSPIQARNMGLKAHLIPPPVDLERFSKAAEGVNGDRSGAVSVAAWGNQGKAPHRVAEWSVANETSIDFYGGGQMAPNGSREIAYEAMPALLASYETFVFLPTVLEPFGRLVAEAHAAGCRVITNRLVGATYWLEDDRVDKIESAAEDFWTLVLS